MDNGAAGPASVVVDVAADEVEIISDTLWFAGADAIGETSLEGPAGDGVRLTAGFATLALARQAASQLDRPCLVEEVADDSWMDAWKTYARPFTVDDRFVVWPTWVELDDDIARGLGIELGRLPVLRLDAGRAFGSGTHPSTALVLDVIARNVHGGETLLDVGCGSGVLALSALLLGAAHVVATDIDPVAVTTTMANAAINGLSERIETFVAGTEPDARYDLVVANIGVVVLRELFPRLRELAPVVVLSGLLVHQVAELAAALDRAAWSTEFSEVVDGWQCVTVRRLPGLPRGDSDR